MMTTRPVSRATPMRRREREKLARLNGILNVGRDLFAEKGYHETTLDEIAERAELGKGTIYNYFRSKEELFLGIIDRLLDELQMLAREALEGSGTLRERLTSFAQQFIGYSSANSDTFHLFMRAAVRMEAGTVDRRLRIMRRRLERSWAVLAQLFEEEIAAGRIRPHDPRELARVFDSMVRCYTLGIPGHLTKLDDRQIAAAAELITAVFFDGVAHRKVKGS